jgi:hypothetical protein
MLSLRVNSNIQKQENNNSDITVVIPIEGDVNPYADKKGGPLKGKEPEFFQWETEKWNNYLKTLSEEERQAHIDAAKTLAEKMDH